MSDYKIYAVPGETVQVKALHSPGDCYIEMNSERPSAHAVATESGVWKDRGAVSSKKDTITALRWQIETGGITLPSGVRVATGIDDQNRITSVIANARLANLDTVSFKAASGWVTLTLAELEGVAAAIAMHVQACFNAERAHHEAIDALADLHAEDPEALQQALEAYVITRGWPSE